LIIREIKKFHKIDAKITQIDELKLNKFDCEITFPNNDGEVHKIKGYVKSFDGISKFQINF
jgi:hypothetical protein